MKPLGLIIDGNHKNGLSLYIGEILMVEGYNVYEEIDISKEELDEKKLQEFSTVIVSSNASLSLDTELMETYLNQGGSVIALRPPVEWDYLFGLKKGIRPMYTRKRDGYLIMNRKNSLVDRVIPEKIQYFGDADLYDVENAKVLNYVSGAPELPSIYPGVAVGSYGRGRTAIFTYDLAECIVKIHQGNPAYASTGAFPDPNGDNKYTPADLFKRQIDYDMKLVPQADVHQDILVRIISSFQESGGPVPRLWHFPDSAPSVIYLDGDSDGMTIEDFDILYSLINKYNGKFSLNIMNKHFDFMTPEIIEKFKKQGHEFGPHIECKSKKPTLEEMKNEVKKTIQSFIKQYGYQPVNHRTHSALWAGWTETAEYLSKAGMRIDTNFTSGVGIREVFLNGSGQPVKFIKENGEIIDIYEQSRPMCDDGPFTPKVVLQMMTYGEAIDLSVEILDICMKYHGVYHQSFHPIYTGPRGKFSNYKWIEELLKACNKAGIPYVNGGEWAEFNDARRSVCFDKYDWNETSGKLQCSINGKMAVKNLTLMLPVRLGSRKVEMVTSSGKRLNYEITDSLEGISWTLVNFDIEPGKTINIEVKYS